MSVVVPLIAADGAKSTVTLIDPPVQAGPQVFTARDFTQASSAFPRTQVIRGSATAKTVYTIAPKSSTKTAPTTGTNPLYLMYSTTGAGVDWEGAEFLGTDQGHLYGGVVLQNTVKAHLADVLVRGIPGAGHAPPTETFLVNLLNDVDTLLERVEADGAGVGAAGIGCNNSVRPTWVDCWVHDHPFSTATFWESTDMTVRGLRSVNNWFGLNFENCGGFIRVADTLLAPVASNTIAMHVRIHNSVADQTDMEFRNLTWANGAGGGATLRFGISDFYHDFTPQQNVIRNRQVTLPKVYNAAGELMGWADAGNGADPAGRTRIGAGGQVMVAPYVPPSHMQDALNDPQHWVVRHH